MQRSNTVYQRGKSMSVDFNVRGQQEMDFFTGGSIIMDYRLACWSEAMV